MTSIKKTLASVIISSGLLAAVGGTFASSETEYTRTGVDQDLIPIEQIIEQTKQDYAGRVIETELERKRSGYVYEIKIMDNSGAVTELKYNAKSGELLRTEREYD